MTPKQEKTSKGYRYLVSFLLLIQVSFLSLDIDIHYPEFKVSSREIPEKVLILYIVTITGLIFGKNPLDKLADIIGENLNLEIHILESRKKEKQENKESKDI